MDMHYVGGGKLPQTTAIVDADDFVSLASF